MLRVLTRSPGNGQGTLTETGNRREAGSSAQASPFRHLISMRLVFLLGSGLVGDEKAGQGTAVLCFCLQCPPSVSAAKKGQANLEGLRPPVFLSLSLSPNQASQDVSHIITVVSGWHNLLEKVFLAFPPTMTNDQENFPALFWARERGALDTWG